MNKRVLLLAGVGVVLAALAVSGALWIYRAYRDYVRARDELRQERVLLWDVARSVAPPAPAAGNDKGNQPR